MIKMSTKSDKSAAIVFIHDFDEEDYKWLDAQKDVLCDRTVIVNNDWDSKMKLFPDQQTLTLETKELIGAFYQSKVKLDEDDIEDMIVLCSGKCADEIIKLCRVLLTPVYKWNVLSPAYTCKATDDVIRANLKAEEEKVSQYLSSLDGNGTINILTSPLIPQALFHHGFSSRNGGISTSTGIKSLNMVYKSSNRDPPCVIAENRKRLAQKVQFDVDHLEVTRAVHGIAIYEVGKDKPKTGYDGVVTNQPRLTCAAPGADCVLMLFADPVKRVCGALHSGWKGTCARACAEMLKAMRNYYCSNVKDIIVVMGPSACKKCCTVDERTAKLFYDMFPECVLRSTQHNKGGKQSIDVRRANRILLQSEGILPENIDDTSATLCTVGNPKAFFSSRQDEQPFGLQIGFIGLRNVKSNM